MSIEDSDNNSMLIASSSSSSSATIPAGSSSSDETIMASKQQTGAEVDAEAKCRARVFSRLLEMCDNDAMKGDTSTSDSSAASKDSNLENLGSFANNDTTSNYNTSSSSSNNNKKKNPSFSGGTSTGSGANSPYDKHDLRHADHIIKQRY